MNYNNLIIWMSARRRGSWSQFRSAVEELHIESGERGTDKELSEDIITTNDLPVYQVVRFNLQRLAHVEFDPKASLEWRVVPPVLALTNIRDSAGGILCGARFPALNDRLNLLDGVVCDIQERNGMPDCIRLLAQDYKSLEVAAQMIGAAIQVQAPNALLSAIPPVDDPKTWYQAEPPQGPGWTIEMFIPGKLCWTARNPIDNSHLEPHDINNWHTGLYRFRMKYQHFYFLRWEGKTFNVPVQVGKYAVIRQQRIHRLIWYTKESSTFSVPVSCRPPLLIERALILCSGFLPQFDKKFNRFEYTNVPFETARLASKLLNQEIEIK
ncbi:MAG: hypothetical protein WC699_03605 [Bacteroidales bacterium]